MRTYLAAILPALVLVALAGPADAAPLVVLAAKPWHYWVAPVLALSFVGMMGALALGYLVRVVLLKRGIRIGPK